MDCGVDHRNRNLDSAHVVMKEDTQWVSAEMRRFLAHIGRKGGSVKSEAKTAAVRRNGKLGGRPRKAT